MYVNDFCEFFNFLYSSPIKTLLPESVVYFATIMNNFYKLFAIAGTSVSIALLILVSFLAFLYWTKKKNGKMER